MNALTTTAGKEWARRLMRDFPTDPMLQHNRLIAAFCDDLFDICMNGKSGTPRSDAVCEISRQLARQDREIEERYAEGLTETHGDPPLGEAA